MLIAQSLGFGFDLCVNTSPSNGRAEEGPQVMTSDDGCDKVYWNKPSLGLGLSKPTSFILQELSRQERSQV